MATYILTGTADEVGWHVAGAPGDNAIIPFTDELIAEIKKGPPRRTAPNPMVRQISTEAEMSEFLQAVKTAPEAAIQEVKVPVLPNNPVQGKPGTAAVQGVITPPTVPKAKNPKGWGERVRKYVYSEMTSAEIKKFEADCKLDKFKVHFAERERIKRLREVSKLEQIAEERAQLEKKLAPIVEVPQLKLPEQPVRPPIVINSEAKGNELQIKLDTQMSCFCTSFESDVVDCPRDNIYPLPHEIVAYIEPPHYCYFEYEFMQQVRDLNW